MLSASHLGRGARVHAQPRLEQLHQPLATQRRHSWRYCAHQRQDDFGGSRPVEPPKYLNESTPRDRSSGRVVCFLGNNMSDTDISKQPPLPREIAAHFNGQLTGASIVAWAAYDLDEQNRFATRYA